MNQPINIVKLIEENPNTKLSKPYQGKLLNKLKDNFSTDEQQLFISSFYCYLNYKSNDFVIDLDDIWRWLGFGRKNDAKKCLEKNFNKEMEYKIVLRQLAENLQGGRPSEKIMLNIRTFKKMCLKANTSKSNEIHEYYLKLEETLHEVIDEESNELRLQLEQKEILLETEKEHKLLLEEENKKSIDEIEKLNKKLHKKYEPKFITDEQFVIYLLIAYINGRTIYIIGKTANITKRYRSYRLKGILIQEEDIKLLYYKSCRSATILHQVENCVILNMSKHIIDGTREVFETTELNEIEMIENFKQIIDFYVDSFKHVSSNIKVYKDNKEEIRIRTELYTEENRDEINEKVREDRKENPEKFQEREKKRNPEKKKDRNKRYYQKHKEKISEYHSEYCDKNYEKISERRKRKYSSMTEEEKKEKAQKSKEYRENNKIRKKENGGQKVKCQVCESIFTRQCWKRHTKSLFHNNALDLNPNAIENYEEVNDDDEIDEEKNTEIILI
jgi:hypothetical protein